ncbi:hypothetical protein NPIL_625821 [Nephila pilipes]|uniref:Uncharacterized protein n=1 Tax=Nephila pilipes TaxID=299642 RepID=A0A8X6Q1E2_NEPPI|nr:hypothetical protein NPIL_625821 [Nephila pilipes]
MKSVIHRELPVTDTSQFCIFVRLKSIQLGQTHANLWYRKTNSAGSVLRPNSPKFQVNLRIVIDELCNSSAFDLIIGGDHSLPLAFPR